MTLWELTIAVEAFNEKQKMQHQLAAWHAANIMNMWSKKPIRPAQLLGEKNIQFASKAEAREFFRQRDADERRPR